MHDLGEVAVQNVVKSGVKDAIAAQIVNDLQLIERQHMLIVNQIAEHLTDFNFFKTYIIRIYAQLILISESKIERKDIDDEIVDRLSTAVQNSAESGISKTYSEVAHSSV